MFESIILRNFQAHTKLKIEFDPAVTVITGPSDIGKSSILRALKWVCTNKPGGDAFIREGSDGTKIILQVDGRRVVRAKGKVNTYRLDGQELKAFGADVPEGVAKLLNVADTNFQGQHDSPYWFSNTAGEVARSLNSVINLGIIDTTLAHLATAGREVAGRISLCEERLKGAREKREELKGAKEAHLNLLAVEGLGAVLEETRAKRMLVGELVQNGERHAQRAENAGNLQSAAELADRAGDEWAEIAKKRENIIKLLHQAERCDIVANWTIPDAGPVDAALGVWREASMKRINLQALVENYDSFEKTIQVQNQCAAVFEFEFIKKAGDVCPLCGNPIKRS